MPEQPQWQIQPSFELPAWFIEAVSQLAGGLAEEAARTYTAQLLWQRGIRDRQQLSAFLNANCYQPASPFEFGQEMRWAIDRIVQAQQQSEKVALWGDFDADGITATAVLWEGLGHFFEQQKQLTYFIPNRLTESHGLSIAGLDRLAEWGCRLIITCDNGSTNLLEIQYANRLGIEVIVTDHHTVLEERPPATAIINPRNLPDDHPLAHLSGVAVAYKLVEALYQTLPEPQQPLETLLDLVAIGLIADLVNLKGDCRYLAQRGIEQLQKNRGKAAPRPGIAKLLELCRKNGDRPTDVSFGLGPRINAISRIQGDARFCVELLTSRDPARCHELALETELANARRRILQRDVLREAKAKLNQLDLSTTSVIVLADPQWSVGILGLVAGQIAQAYGRPTILLSLEEAEQPIGSATRLARGSARSIDPIDLYQLMKEQAPLLSSFGGHPLAAGLSLPAENIPLFTEAINRQMRQQSLGGAIVSADLALKVADLCHEEGKPLFSALRLLEPCGMGNPVPKLLIKNCWFTKTWHKKIKASRGDQDGLIKTEFELCDESSDRSFPGIWWGHYKDELPSGRCEAVVELDFNSYEDPQRKMHYEVRLVAVRSQDSNLAASEAPVIDWILDWRRGKPDDASEDTLQISECPRSWAEFQHWMQRAIESQRPLAIAYPAPSHEPPIDIWQTLIGIAKHLSRTGKTVPYRQLCEKLEVGDRTLEVGLRSLAQIGFEIRASDTAVAIGATEAPEDPAKLEGDCRAEAQFLAAVREEQFYRRYFYEVSLETVRSAAEQMVKNLR